MSDKKISLELLDKLHHDMLEYPVIDCVSVLLSLLVDITSKVGITTEELVFWVKEVSNECKNNKMN
jgi:hypothetical protein